MKNIPNILYATVLAAVLCTPTLTLAQDDLDLEVEDIRADCMRWAERDEISERELHEYIATCVREELEVRELDPGLAEPEPDDEDAY